MEIRKPNYQMLFNSAVVAKQQAFQKYKQIKAAIDETRRTPRKLYSNRLNWILGKKSPSLFNHYIQIGDKEVIEYAKMRRKE